jgi:hypothetical protein
MLTYTDEPLTDKKISLFEFTVASPVPGQEEFWVINLSPMGVIVDVKRTLNLAKTGNLPVRKVYIVAVSEKWKARWAYFYFKLHPATKDNFSFLSSSNLISDCWVTSGMRSEMQNRKLEIWNDLGSKETSSPAGRGGKTIISQFRYLLRYWESPVIPHGHQLISYVESMFLISRQSGHYSGYLIAKRDQNDQNVIAMNDVVLMERYDRRQFALTLRDINLQDDGHNPIVSWLLEK